MKRFTQLYFELDETNRTSEKVAALVRYFREAPARDAAWGLFFLIGGKIKRAVSGPILREMISEVTGYPHWLISECYDAVGDLAETAALLMPDTNDAGVDPGPLYQIVEQKLAPLPAMTDEQRREVLVEAWQSMDQRQRFVWNKLITGAFRVGVAKTLVIRGLAMSAGIEPTTMAHRLMGTWQPTEDDFLRLLKDDGGGYDPRRPYPFALAYPLELSKPGSGSIADPEAAPPEPEDDPNMSGHDPRLDDHAGRSRDGAADDPMKKAANALARMLGPVTDWQVEWKWDGIRAQLLRRGEDVLIWSRGEDLITDRFPEIVAVGQLLPDGTVLDGEILAWRHGRSLRFGELQKRINLRTVTKRIQAQVPIVFMAYDLIEMEGRDIRQESLKSRRAALEALIESAHGESEQKSAREPVQYIVTGETEDMFAHESVAPPPTKVSSTESSVSFPPDTAEFPLMVSPKIRRLSWESLARVRAKSREEDAEGLMLKRLSSAYHVGRVRGDWWKWKIEPYTIDAVLIYAQRGSGRRASLLTDYTFGLWSNGELVPVAKAYSGLTDAEIRDCDAWIRHNTIEKFGPIRAVKPEQVFELAFEAIQTSSRHKSGVAVRFPRIKNWRHDKHAHEADTLDALKQMARLNEAL